MVFFYSWWYCQFHPRLCSDPQNTGGGSLQKSGFIPVNDTLAQTFWSTTMDLLIFILKTANAIWSLSKKGGSLHGSTALMPLTISLILLIWISAFGT